MSRWTARRGDERGAFLVLWAVLVTGMMIMLAIVIDLGHVRASRRSMQSFADLSLLAGGVSFSTPVGLDPMSACRETVDYLNQNLPDIPAEIDANGFCNQSGKELNKTVCNPPFSQAQATPSTVAGPYTIELHYPVPDDEIRDASGVRSNDGEPCERMRLLVSRKDKSFFAGIVGVSTLASNASATIRRMPMNASLMPALWLLDPTGCTSLEVNGSGTTVTVGTPGSPAVAPIPGVVTIDSDGSTCSSNQYTLASSGNLVAYPLVGSGYDVGMISLFALPSGRRTCVAPACNPAEVPSNIQPQPVRRDKRATRAPVDWRFDCKTKYPAYTVPGNSTRVLIPDCPNAGTTQPYITQLRDPVVGVNDQVNKPPPGFIEYKGSCTPGAGVMPAGNLWIRCNKFSVKSRVEFQSQNVVFDGSVDISTGAGQMIFNHVNTNGPLSPACRTSVCPLASSPEAAFIFLRNGDLTVSGGGSFDLDHTFIYEAGGAINSGGNGSPVWDAPTDGPFRGLAYWNETRTRDISTSFQISGGASMSLGGVFFTPQADPFTISGGSPAVQQNAQFVSRRAKISGGGTLNLTPNQTDAVQLPPPAAILIR